MKKIFSFVCDERKSEVMFTLTLCSNLTIKIIKQKYATCICDKNNINKKTELKIKKIVVYQQHYEENRHIYKHPRSPYH